MKRICCALSALAALISSSTALAADKLSFGAAPSWVVAQKIPQPSATGDQPVEILLHDQQTLVEGGKTTTYSEAAIKFRTADGLAAGSVSLPWNPAIQAITVNKLQIHRGEDVIDVLESGQTFTIMRRETNFELATLDGQLTAALQPEGLQEGDILVLATTTEQHDPVLQDHIQLMFGDWGSSSIRSANARIIWPASHDLKFRFTGLSAPPPTTQGDKRLLEIKLQNVEPLIAPKGAPARFLIGRLGEATDFASWAEVADLMRPLFKSASSIGPAGPLRDEVEKIRTRSSDAKQRATRALALVQSRIRYVALLMGQGTYVPARAEETWARRFGDCKGKTALLLALLHELGIEAEPVLVQSRIGDAIADRLPMLAVFDHVVVRAHVDGRTHWLDGTRTGDTNFDEIIVPSFGWGLPVVENAELIHIVPGVLDTPLIESALDIDARAGIRASVPTRVNVILRGDSARSLNLALSGLSQAQRDEFQRSYWKGEYEFVTIKSIDWKFDRPRSVLEMSMSGDAKLDWSGGLFHVPGTGVGTEHDFHRREGPRANAPWAVSHPAYVKTITTVRLPKGFFPNSSDVPQPINERLAGVEYRRTVRRENDTMIVETQERSLVAEVPFTDAKTAEARLKSLVEEDIALRVPQTYRLTDNDIEAISTEKPSSAKEFQTRGVFFLDQGKFDEAISDFTKMIALAPNDPWGYGNRAVGHAWKREFEKSAADIAKAETLDADLAMLPRAKGLLAEMKEDFGGAVEAYTKALTVNPGDYFALLHRSSMYRKLDQDESALADLDRLVTLGTRKSEVRLARANLFVSMDKPEAAAIEARLLIKENPQDDYAHVAAGRIFARVRNNDEALKAFDAAIALSPEAYVYLNRAQARPLADQKGRLADLDLALKLDPTNALVLAEKAEQLIVGGDLAAALDHYDRAIAADPKQEELITFRAVVLYKMGRTSEAERILAERRNQAKTATDFNNLCWHKATAGILLSSALDDCRQALKIQPESGAFSDSLGLVLYRVGRLDEALTSYSKAIEKNVGSAPLYGRALVHSARGDRASAEADRVAALKEDPDVETRFAEYGLKLKP